MFVEQALSCPFGGFPSIRHNKLCDITAARFVTMSVLNQICNHCQGNIFIINLLMLKMKLALISMRRISGVRTGGWLILT